MSLWYTSIYHSNFYERYILSSLLEFGETIQQFLQNALIYDDFFYIPFYDYILLANSIKSVIFFFYVTGRISMYVIHPFNVTLGDL